MLIDGETRPANEIRETKVDICLDGEALITCEYQIFTTVQTFFACALAIVSNYNIESRSSHQT